VSISYASPGWIELSVVVLAFMGATRFIKSVSGAINQANSTYHEVVTGLSKRKLLKLEVKKAELDFEREELEHINNCTKSMARLLGFHNLDEINRLTGNPYKTLKILLAVYRRARTMAKLEHKEKIQLPRNRPI
jgi:hypothetical protein